MSLYVAGWPVSGEKLSIFEFANSLSNIVWGAAKQLYFRSLVYELQTQTAFISTVGNFDSFLFWFRFNIPPSQCFWGGSSLRFHFYVYYMQLFVSLRKPFIRIGRAFCLVCDTDTISAKLNSEQPPSEPNTAHTKTFYQTFSTDTK